MHQPGVVADEQGAAPQHRGGGQQIGAADEIDEPPGRQGGEQRRRLRAARAPPPAPRPGRRRTARPARSAAAPARRSARRAIACRANSRRGRSPAPAAAGRHQRRGGALVRRRGPQTRARRRIEIEQAGELAHAMLARVALGHDTALAGAQQPGERRAAQIDDEIPAPPGDARVERQPMQRASAALSRRSGARAPARRRTAARPPARRRSSSRAPGWRSTRCDSSPVDNTASPIRVAVMKRIFIYGERLRRRLTFLLAPHDTGQLLVMSCPTRWARDRTSGGAPRTIAPGARVSSVPAPR